MFEDTTPGAGATPPSNLPLEPEDLLASVEGDSDARPVGSAPTGPPDALAAGKLKPRSGTPSPPLPAPRSAPRGEAPASFGEGAVMTRGPLTGKIVIGILAVLLLGAIVAGIWWVVKRVKDEPASVPAAAPVEAPAPALAPAPSAPAPETGSVVIPSPPVTNEQILFGEPTDSDGDGLDDQREKELGTDPAAADSDGDQLSDGDEVIVWKTNPNKVDTDGDGHEDGKEARFGYNPLGPGKLPNLPTSSAPGR